MKGLGLNVEHAPDIIKRVDKWSILGRYDDQTDSKDGKRGRRLDEHYGNACKRVGHLGGEDVPRLLSQPQETEADHRGDDDIQAHGQRYPRRDGVDRLSVQKECGRMME